MVGPAVPPPVPKLGWAVGEPAVGEPVLGMAVSSINLVGAFEDSVVVSGDGATVSAVAVPDGATEGESANMLSDGPAVGVATVEFADGVTVGEVEMVGGAPTSAKVQLHLATARTVVPSELTNTPSAGRVSTVF
jgi:hypothetical protein